MKFPEFRFEEITDSRGIPTIAAKAEFSGQEVIAKVPGGTSVGSHEAKVLSVEKVLVLERELNTLLNGSSFSNLSEFDQTLLKKDGTNNKENLGGNTILALSMLFCRLAALEAEKELAEWLRGVYMGDQSKRTEFNVVPMMVIIEGGRHASLGSFIQEILVNGSIQDGQKVWELLERRGHPLGLEGGFDVPYIDHTKADTQAIADVKRAIEEVKVLVTVSIDVAANNLPSDSQYNVASIIQLIKDWQLFSVEDPFLEDNWSSWSQLVREIKGHRLDTVIVGDDLTVTNKSRLEEALERQAVTGVIIKPNQVGSVSETLEFTKLAQENNCQLIVSHRSGETDDTFIADLAVAVAADSLKSGAPLKPERQIKYERLAQLQTVVKV